MPSQQKKTAPQKKTARQKRRTQPAQRKKTAHNKLAQKKKIGQQEKPAQKTKVKKKPAVTISTQEPAALLALMKEPAQEIMGPYQSAQNHRATRTYERKSQFVGRRGGVWTLVGWRELWELTTPPPP